MAVEIGLVDATKIRLRDPEVTGERIMQMLDEAKGGFISIAGEQGSYQVNAAHVVYVRMVEGNPRAPSFR